VRIRADVRGDLAKGMQSDVARLERQARGAVSDASEGLKQDLRTQVASAGLGRRLANTWRSRVYPSQPSLRAAGLVYTRAPVIMSAFASGATIRARGHRYLAIPTEAVVRRQGRKLTPADFAEAGIALRFVPPGGRRPALLVADNFVACKRGFRVATGRRVKSGRGLATVVMFILVPQVRLRRRLDVDRPAQAWQQRLLADMARATD
jgi:hypothetical protein